MKNVALLIALLFGSIASAQKIVAPTAEPVEKVKKNEIGLNLSGPFHDGRSELLYKRAIKENLYGRVSFQYLSTQLEFPRNGHSGKYVNGQPLEVSPSFYTVYRIDEHKYKTGGAIGIEKRKNVKNFTLFCGADLCGGITRQNTAVYEDKMSVQYDTAQAPNGTTVTATVDFIGTNQTGNIQIKGMYFGLRPFSGIMVPLGKRFLVSTQVTLNLDIETATMNSTYATPTSPNSYSTLNFDTELLLSNISLFYIF